MKKSICWIMSVMMIVGIMTIPVYATEIVEPSDSSGEIQNQVSPKAGVITRFSQYTSYNVNSMGTDIMTPTGFSRGTTTTGTYVNTGSTITSLSISAFQNIITANYLEAFISTIGAVPAATMSALVEEGFTQDELVEFKRNNGDSMYINYKITAYNKNGNNSLYSEHLYCIRIYGTSDCTGIPAIAVVKKVTEAT